MQKFEVLWVKNSTENNIFSDMTGELIGNEIQPEGGIEEVLLPPIRAGLKRSLRERKTRLKDINYHLGRIATKNCRETLSAYLLYNFATRIRKFD